MSGAIPFCKNCGGFSSIVLHSRCYPDDPKDMQLHDFTMPPQIQSFVINASASRVADFSINSRVVLEKSMLSSVDRDYPRCFKQGLPQPPNFTSYIPSYAHQETQALRDIKAYITADFLQGEGILRQICSPPGFGKTAVVDDAAFACNSYYILVNSCSSLLVSNFVEVCDKLLLSVKLEILTVISLLELFRGPCFSFVSRLLDISSEKIKNTKTKHLGCLQGNGFTVYENVDDSLKKSCVKMNEILVDKNRLTDGNVKIDDRKSYLLISLSLAFNIAVNECRLLRVVFSGTSHAAEHLLKYDSGLKIANCVLGESDVVFVREVVRQFINLDHLSEEYLDTLFSKLAGCKRSVQWFLHAVATKYFNVNDPLTTGQLNLAVLDALQKFQEQTSHKLGLNGQAAVVSNEALLAFVFYEFFSGALENDCICFPIANFPQEWFLWAQYGAIHIECANNTVRLYFPYFFMMEFLRSNAQTTLKYNKETFRSLFLSCFAQTDTFSSIAFQLGCAAELAHPNSSLKISIENSFNSKMKFPKLSSDIKLFTLISDLGNPTNIEPYVHVVVDRCTISPGYVDLAIPVTRGSTGAKVFLKIELKRVKDPSALRAKCVEFFQICLNEKDCDKSFYLFLSYYSLDLDSSITGKNRKEIQRITNNYDNFRVMDEEIYFSKCSVLLQRLGNGGNAETILGIHQNLRNILSPQK